VALLRRWLVAKVTP